MTHRRRPAGPVSLEEDTDRWLLVHLTLGAVGIGLVLAAVIFAVLTFPHPDHGGGQDQLPAAAAEAQP